MTAFDPPARPESLRSLFVRSLLGSGIAVAIVFIALWSSGLLTHLPAMHRHAPQLSLLAAAPAPVKIHLAAVAVALLIGLVLLTRVKGTALHRTLGWIWVASMGTAAVSSLFIRIVNHGHFSLIHLLAGWTLITLPFGMYFARTHRVKLHARFMTGLFTGGLVLAGLLAFFPGRLIWRVVFG